MSKIHNLVYDLQQKELAERYGNAEKDLSKEAIELRDRIEYLDFEIEAIMKERIEVVKAYRKEISK